MQERFDGEARGYTIGQLARLAGVSTRTLRHYEDEGLLHPSRTDSNYRIYRDRDARRLAQVIAMRACGLPLPTIRRLLEDPGADVIASLSSHLRSLLQQERSLEEAIARTEKAIAAIERMKGMDSETAFDELKKKGLEDFERTYGKEARQLYGESAIDAANERMMALSRDEWDARSCSKIPSRCSCAWRWHQGMQPATYDEDMHGAHARAKYPHVAGEMARAVEGNPAPSLLDLGCGTDALSELVLGWDSSSDDDAISMHVSRARRKLSAAGTDPIETVWRMGHKWSV